MVDGLMEHMNCSFLTLLCTFVKGEASGKNGYSYCYSSTELQDIPLLASVPMRPFGSKPHSSQTLVVRNSFYST